MSSKQSGLQLLEQLLHAARLELEHVRRLTRLQERVGGGVVQRRCARARTASSLRSGRLLISATAMSIDGQRLETEEVELDQARRFDVVLVVLGDETPGSGQNTGT